MAKRGIEGVNKMKNREEAEEATSVQRNSTVKKIASNDGVKDQQISAKVNRSMYSAFTTINKAQGVTNNSALNMLIAKYVRENRDILEEENLF